MRSGKGPSRPHRWPGCRGGELSRVRLKLLEFPMLNIFSDKMPSTEERPEGAAVAGSPIMVKQYEFYEKDLLGEGFSSRVYRGYDTRNRRYVAIKHIDVYSFTQAIHTSLLKSELETLEYVQGCDNVLQVYSIARLGRNVYIVSELCDTDLSKLVASNMPAESTNRLIAQLIKGFAGLHAKKVIHRDFKPGNLLLDSRGNLKISDFGFAILESECKAQAGFNIGSPLYMAPEILRDNQYSHQSDIWALGITIYELLAGDTPWQAENEEELLKVLQEQKIQVLLEPADFPANIKTLLARMLQFERKHRITPEQLFQLQAKFAKQQKPAYKNQQHSSTEECQGHKKQQRKKSKTEIYGKSAPLQTCPQSASYYTDEMMTITISRQPLGKAPSDHDSKQTAASTITTNRSQVEQADQTLEPMPRQQQRAITNQLVYYIHACRLMFKIVVRIGECLTRGCGQYLQEVLGRKSGDAAQSYCNLVVDLLYKLKNFDGSSLIHLSPKEMKQYMASGEFNKVRKAAVEYIDKYAKSEELQAHWNSAEAPVIENSIDLTETLIGQMWPELCQRNHNEIILLEFLLFNRELLRAIKSDALEQLEDKERIHDFVDTIPNPPNLQRFKQAIASAKRVSLELKNK